MSKTSMGRRNLARLSDYVAGLTDQQCRDRLLDAMRCAFPEHEPDQEWDAETIEWVVGALFGDEGNVIEALGLEVEPQPGDDPTLDPEPDGDDGTDDKEAHGWGEADEPPSGLPFDPHSRARDGYSD